MDNNKQYVIFQCSRSEFYAEITDIIIIIIMKISSNTAISLHCWIKNFEKKIKNKCERVAPSIARELAIIAQLL